MKTPSVFCGAMKEVTGDLVKLAKNGEFDVIVHGCNCECIMSGGIAKQIRQAFPKAYEADRGTTACHSRKIGSLSFAKVKLENGKYLVIVNGYTQLLAGGQVNYDAVRDVMKQEYPTMLAQHSIRSREE